MTYEHIEELRRELVESVAIQLSHYYEDEEDFEEKFGSTDDIADAVELYLKYKNEETICQMCKKWIHKCPNDKEYLLSLFELDEEDIFNNSKESPMYVLT